MLKVSVEIDRAAVARLEALLDRVAKETPSRLATETRRAALYICQGLKKRTRSAPKRIPRREYAAEPSPHPPRYIHARDGRLLRRWAFTRKLGTPDAYTMHYYVYTDAHRGKGGRMTGKNAAAERRELLRFHGGIPRRGLARKSWGWLAKRVFSGSSMGDLSWKRSKGERRDPRLSVGGHFRRRPDGADARLINALDYISAVVPPAVVSQAVTAAANRLEHNIRNRLERTLK